MRSEDDEANYQWGGWANLKKMRKGCAWHEIDTAVQNYRTAEEEAYDEAKQLEEEEEADEAEEEEEEAAIREAQGRGQAAAPAAAPAAARAHAEPPLPVPDAGLQ